MERVYKTLAPELTKLQTNAETGTFTGYASTFGNVDLEGDVIDKGAFAESIQKSNGKVPVLYQHAHDKPIGKAYVEEDEKGLYISKGELNLDLQLAKDVQSNASKGIIDSFSVGFVVGEKDYTWRGKTRVFRRVGLMELSFVTFPANPQARLNTMKSMDQIETVRDFERFLREAGFTRAEAKTIAGCGYRALERRDAALGLAKLTQLIEELKHECRS